MKSNFYKYILSILYVVALGCGEMSSHDNHGHDEHGHEEHGHDEHEEGVVHLTLEQQKAVGIQLGHIEEKPLSGVVYSNGKLEVPPQNQANVSSFMGGTVKRINVIEGEKVKAGQVLALLEHPKIVKMQVEYQKVKSQLTFLEQEYQRQEKLYKGKVSSGQTFQQTQSKYFAVKAKVKGLEAQLKMVNISPASVEKGNITSYIEIKSPIDGFIKEVDVALGTYIQPRQELFDVINNEHVHVDLMVFEQDVHQVKEGQTVYFSVAQRPNDILKAEIIAVSRAFEDAPKAVHVHAEIDEKDEHGLIAGMYVKGRIVVSQKMNKVVPEDAVVEDAGRHYIFVRSEDGEHHAPKEKEHKHEEHEGEHNDEHSEGKDRYELAEVVMDISDLGWVAIRPLEALSAEKEVVVKGAYYLLSELKKGEAGHGHHH